MSSEIWTKSFIFRWIRILDLLWTSRVNCKESSEDRTSLVLEWSKCVQMANGQSNLMILPFETRTKLSAFKWSMWFYHLKTGQQCCPEFVHLLYKYSYLQIFSNLPDVGLHVWGHCRDACHGFHQLLDNVLFLNGEAGSCFDQLLRQGQVITWKREEELIVKLKRRREIATLTTWRKRWGRGRGRERESSNTQKDKFCL